jgi:tetratricopeptide (TPR) repeat protein
MIGRALILSASLVTGPSLAWAQEDHSHANANTPSRLGNVIFANSGAKAAQADFLRGVALLHSFEYEDAAKAFKAAQHHDKNFALSYWMEALTYRHPLWGQEDLDAARGALASLGPSRATRLTRAKTARERAYGEAVEALFAQGDEADRVRAFAEEMSKVANAYPDDLEASAFAALASLGLWAQLPRASATPQVENAIRYAQRVFASNPKHPGASHYLIHAYDDPKRAERGLPFAREYAQIAPDAEHAVHMPSHIFLQLGLWDDVVASNERAWAASRAWVARNKLPNTDSDFHSFTWLQYGYLQQGRYNAARGLIDTLSVLFKDIDFGEEFSDAAMAGPDLTFRYRVATGDWSDINLPSAGRQDERHSPRAVAYTSTMLLERAITAAMRGDTANARSLVTRIQSRADSALAGDYGRGSYTTGLNIASALIAKQSGDMTKAIEVLQVAGELEAKTSPAGPPYLPPALEILGNTLLEAGRPQEAIAAFTKELALRRNRSESLLGLARARLAAGDAKGGVEAYSKLLVNWKNADPNLPALAEAKGVVQGISAR